MSFVRFYKSILFIWSCSFFFLSSLHVHGQRDIDTLIASLSEKLIKEHIPGAMLSIVRTDSIIFTGGVGYADAEQEILVNDQHLFRLGSISKSITAMGLVKLAEEGKITLQTPISQLDERLAFDNPWKDIAPVTVEHLLEHTAGYDDMHFHAFYNKTDSIAPSCYSMLEAQSKSLYSRWQPGTRMAYSNPGYVVAGHLIEIITQKTYAAYLKEELLEPMGMITSGFYFKSPKDFPMSRGYVYEGYKLKPVEFASIQGGPAGEFCSNAAEMALFMQYMLGKGGHSLEETSVITQESFDRIEYPETTLAAKNGFAGGYGLGNLNVWKNGHLFHGHDGGIDGFSSLYLYSRDADIGVAISINKPGNVWQLMDMVLDQLIPISEHQHIDIPPKQPISDQIKEKYEGFYSFKNPRNQLFAFFQSMNDGVTIHLESDFLTIKDFYGNVKDTLYHHGQNIFYRINTGLPTATLLDNNEGNPAFWLSNDYAEKSNYTLRQVSNYLIYFVIAMAFLHFLIGFVWLFIHYFGNYSTSIKLPLFLWLGVFSFVLIPICFLYALEFSSEPAGITVPTVLLYLSTIITPICTLIASYLLVKSMEIQKWLRAYYGLIIFCLIIISILLVMNHMVGFRMWAY